ncbi:MAG: chloride channel protein [Polyangiaceae bacterium]|nr:chloride channel protein [Polyangiaceae bacterium]
MREKQSPIDLQHLGRTLLHAIVVGAAAGLVSAAFSTAVERVQHWLLTSLAGYSFLRAAGERASEGAPGVFRPWLLVWLPALGAGLAGYIGHRFAPEVLGGGGNAAIRVFHKRDAITRKRVPWLKAIASILTLGSGGSGGREGPTMQIGSSMASLVARWLKTSPRERRILYVAGIAAGVSAVFRTPLGAALFAAEVLYRDDFESDALVPAVLASVVGYSVGLPFGESSRLFAHADSYPFVPGHLPFFAALALFEVALALTFLRALKTVRMVSGKMPGPVWMRPGYGGLALGILTVPLLFWLGTRLGRPGGGFGILGGGYGAAQVAITGADWLPGGWRGVQVLAALCALKLVASSFTLGTGGSAGDFAPSLVLGGLLGGAFGRATQLLTGDATINPGAFALVGMGTLFGGIAHVPLSSMVLVCELAGSYDLIVPLMLAEGIAFVALRRHHLYEAQPSSRSSAVETVRAQQSLRVGDLAQAQPGARTFGPATGGRAMLDAVGDATWQVTFPVLNETGKIVGVVPSKVLHVVASEEGMADWVVASDLMQEPMVARFDEPAIEVLTRMLAAGLRQIPVLNDQGQVAAYLDERSVASKLVVELPVASTLDATTTPLAGRSGQS